MCICLFQARDVVSVCVRKNADYRLVRGKKAGGNQACVVVGLKLDNVISWTLHFAINARNFRSSSSIENDCELLRNIPRVWELGRIYKGSPASTDQIKMYFVRCIIV